MERRWFSLIQRSIAVDPSWPQFELESELDVPTWSRIECGSSIDPESLTARTCAYVFRWVCLLYSHISILDSPMPAHPPILTIVCGLSTRQWLAGMPLMFVGPAFGGGYVKCGWGSDPVMFWLQIWQFCLYSSIKILYYNYYLNIVIFIS